MAQDITEQADQAAIADTLVADPEPIEQPQEQTETEAPEEVQAEAAETEEVAESEEVAEDWLPDEQSKIFPDEAYSQYAQNRYPELAKLLTDKNTPEPTREQVRQILHDKINSDIYFQQLQQQQANQQEEEPEIEEVAQPEAQPEPTRTEPQLTREQYFQGLNQAIQQRTDPQVAQDFFTEFNKAFGLSPEEIAASIKANPNAPMEFTQTMSKYALNLMNTFADDLISSRLGSHIEQAFPQFGEMYQTGAAARSWDAIRTEVQDVELPAYGTREYSSAARQIGAEIAGSSQRFESMIFSDQNGKQLSPQANLAEKQRMIAERMAAGQEEQKQPAVPPALVAQAVKTGQKIAQRQTAKRDAGNLGSGKSRAQIANQGGAADDIFGEGVEIYKREHGSL